MPVRVEKWDIFELALKGPESGNPFLDVTFEADFAQADQKVHVRGFYDGDGAFKLRFMPNREGEWHYVTHSNVAELDELAGSLICTLATAGNHGPVRVADTYHFAYEDSTPYIPVGTTCYVWNLQGDELEEQTLKTLDTAPFNKIRMSVFPKRYLFNNNEPPTYPFVGQVTGPWDPDLLNNFRNVEPPRYWDFNRFNPEHFRRLEKRILDLRARGIEADLIIFHPYDFGAWGFDRMPAEVNDHYLHYLVARLSAFRNLWWSFANEYDLFFERKMEDWDHYMQLVEQIDPYNHLRSIHNCGTFYDHTKPWVTHCSVQSHVIARVPVWRKMYNKPVVIDECGYEGNIHTVWGDLSPEEMVMRFWLGFVNGGYVGHGETYANAGQGPAEQVLWWSKGGQLHGDSAARIAFLRRIFEGAPALTPVEKTDNEFNDLMSEAGRQRMFSHRQNTDRIILEGSWNIEAGGFHGDDTYLFYFGMHQPASRNFVFSDGNYRIDVIDTWNMIVETVAEQATGYTCVNLPGRKFMAIRIQKNMTSRG
jgi:hypothetical protein